MLPLRVVGQTHELSASQTVGASAGVSVAPWKVIVDASLAGAEMSSSASWSPVQLTSPTKREGRSALLVGVAGSMSPDPVRAVSPPVPNPGTSCQCPDQAPVSGSTVSTRRMIAVPEPHEANRPVKTDVMIVAYVLGLPLGGAAASPALVAFPSTSPVAVASCR